jgi:hypothetical protein
MKYKVGVAVVSAIWLICCCVGVSRANARYMCEYLYHWKLADKASTIAAKQKEIHAFVEVLEKGDEKGEFAKNNAVFFPTPDNAFANNLEMLKTLEQRLGEIQAMDPKSFEYNTAIQQITAQEQGEAHEMLRVLDGCWTLQNYWWMWDWKGILVFGGLIIAAIAGMLLAIDEADHGGVWRY